MNFNKIVDLIAANVRYYVLINSWFIFFWYSLNNDLIDKLIESLLR